MFLGKDGFVWWIGVVEDIEDDLLLGRAKVRIFGYHPDYDSGKLDTIDLPYAYTIMPLNIPNAYARPELGDWVFGFFLDADEAEEPAILGYLPGIPSGSGSFGRYKKDRRSFHNTSAATANSFSITTRSGHTLDFQDAADAESITLTHKNRNTLTMAANSDITIKHQKGPTITLNNAGETGRINLQVANTSTFSNTNMIMGCQQISLQACSNGVINIQRGNARIRMFANNDIQIDARNILIDTGLTGDVFARGVGGLYGVTQKFFELDQINALQNTQIDSALSRLDNPTFGSSNGFTAIVDI